jgi:hypothetical protein
VPAPSKTIDLITKIILRNFWAKSGRAHSRKKVVDRLARVRTFDLLQIQLFLLSDVYSNVWSFFFLLIVLFWTGETSPRASWTPSDSWTWRDSRTLRSLQRLATEDWSWRWRPRNPQSPCLWNNC